MAGPTINGAKLMKAGVRMPQVGPWHADAESDGTAALSGAVTMVIEGVTFVGTVIPSRSGASGSRVRTKIVGGAGGLSGTLDAKQYASGPTVGDVVRDVLDEAGETLSATAETAVLAASFPKWERSRGPASRALADVLESTGASWRVLADGTVWVGVETFPEQTVSHVLIDEDMGTGVLDLAPTAPDLRPAVTFLGHRITYVVHRLASSSLRTEAYVTGGPANSFERIMGGIRREIDFSRTYGARVVSQAGDGTLQLMPDSERMRGFGLSGVKIRHGVPGSVTVPAGARCRLAFEDGDPGRPYAMLWDTAALTELKLGAGTDSVALASPVESQLDDLKSAINGWTPVANDGGAALKVALTAWLASSSTVAAAKVKAE